MRGSTSVIFEQYDKSNDVNDCRFSIAPAP